MFKFFTISTQIKKKENKIRNELVHSVELDSRQLETLGHFKKNSNLKLTVQEYKSRNKISYETAKSDLLEVMRLNLLEKLTSGKKFIFFNRVKCR